MKAPRPTIISRRTFGAGVAAGAAALLAAGCSSQTDDAQDAADDTADATDAADAESTEDDAPNLSTVRTTAYGDVQGIVSDGVEVYYNVPYGKDPTGELRWHAPEAPDAWEDTLDCTENTKRALQMGTVYAADGSSSTELMGTTDCLNLDVYTTADADGLPVMVYVHGGNNQTGTSTELPGAEIVKQASAVYVSVDYRLGLLGYNCLPALMDDEVTTGNFGMLDIAAALTWVRENVAQFGGDPQNVTVSGFSAGGRNVMAMLVSPQFAGLFDRAIAFSGGMTIANLEESIAQTAATIAPLAVEDGMAGTEEEATAWLQQDAEEVRDYLYDLDAERLTQLMSDAGIRMSAFPHLFGDDVMLPSTGFSGGAYVSDVPLMMLTGETEFSMFCMGSPVYDELGDESEAALAFATSYGSDLYRIFNTQTSAATMDGAYDSDLYLVQVNYGGADSEYQIDTLGSFHGIFVPMLGGHNYDSFYDFTEEGYQAMAGQFMTYLGNFLRGADVSEGADVEWPAWTAESPQTLILDAADGAAKIEAADVFETPAEVIAEMQADDTLSDEAKTRVMTKVMNGRWFSTLLDETTGTDQAVHLD